MKPLGTADRLQSKYLKFPACELWSADSVPSQPRPLDQQIRRRPSLYPVGQQSGGTLALSSICINNLGTLALSSISTRWGPRGAPMGIIADIYSKLNVGHLMDILG